MLLDGRVFGDVTLSDVTILHGQRKVLGTFLIQVGGAGNEEALELPAELSTDPEVDEEIERVAEQNTQVDEEGRHVYGLVIQHQLSQEVRQRQEKKEDGKRELHQQNETDNGNHHQCRTVAVRQAAPLLTLVLPQQHLKLAFHVAQRPDEQRN